MVCAHASGMGVKVFMSVMVFPSVFPSGIWAYSQPAYAPLSEMA